MDTKKNIKEMAVSLHFSELKFLEYKKNNVGETKYQRQRQNISGRDE